MGGFSAKITLALVVPVLLAARLVVAEDASSIPLSEDDLQNITLQVLEKNPLLASSPGIKYASADSAGRSTDAEIIYYPHAESAGMKEAFQVHCQREMPNELWTCNQARIRRYLQLESQDFEVRVRGEIGSEGVLALIKATRETLQAIVTDGSTIPQTAIMVYQYNDSYLVSWGNSEGYGKLMVQAYLREGGNPANSENWQASIFKPKDQ